MRTPITYYGGKQQLSSRIIAMMPKHRIYCELSLGCLFLILKNKIMETKKLTIPEGWEIDKVEGNEIILKESKKELPKTWEECYKLLGEGEVIETDCTINPCNTKYPYTENKNIIPVGLGKPLLAFCQLLVCRNVYRNGWFPDWKDQTTLKYCIYCGPDIILYENIRDLIEEAKELI